MKNKGKVYDVSDEVFVNIVENSTSYSECLRKLGYNCTSGSGSTKVLKARIRELGCKLKEREYKKYGEIKENIKIGNSKHIPTEEMLIENSPYSRNTVRRRLLKENLVEYVCCECGLGSNWNHKELTLQLHHKNGIDNDHRLENLGFICPNCHSQTSNYAGKHNRCKQIKNKVDTSADTDTNNTDTAQGKTNTCIDCGKLISNQATRCIECATKYKATNNRLKRENFIKFDEFKKLIRTKPILHIADMFNISDNAIRKWCKSYGLPYKPTDVQNYSKKEWDAITFPISYYIYILKNEKKNEVFIGNSTIPDLEKNFKKDYKIIGLEVLKNESLFNLLQKTTPNDWDVSLVDTVTKFTEVKDNENKLSQEYAFKNYKIISNKIKEKITDKDAIIELYKELQNITAVSKKANICVDTVRKILIENNIKIISSQEIMKNNYGTKVNALSLDGKFIKSFQTMAEAIIFATGNDDARYIMYSTRHITAVCKGKRKSAYGYKWEYVTPEKEVNSNA